MMSPGAELFTLPYTLLEIETNYLANYHCGSLRSAMLAFPEYQAGRRAQNGKTYIVTVYCEKLGTVKLLCVKPRRHFFPVSRF